ncbi:MAG: hypothetical protein U1C97_03340 [Candidatus Gracilibacteria bacterium]|nr:hypothetical protein [bacterium]MDZ4217321.1 hypothetical protein [Candidatus Gracilibacteria bacterium]
MVLFTRTALALVLVLLVFQGTQFVFAQSTMSFAAVSQRKSHDAQWSRGIVEVSLSITHSQTSHLQLFFQEGGQEHELTALLSGVPLDSLPAGRVQISVLWQLLQESFLGGELEKQGVLRAVLSDSNGVVTETLSNSFWIDTLPPRNVNPVTLVERDERTSREMTWGKAVDQFFDHYTVCIGFQAFPCDGQGDLQTGILFPLYDQYRVGTYIRGLQSSTTYTIGFYAVDFYGNIAKLTQGG